MANWQHLTRECWTEDRDSSMKELGPRVPLIPACRPKMHNGCPCPAPCLAGEREGPHIGMPRQDRVNRLTQLPYALAVDHAHFEDAFLPAHSEILQHHLLHVLRAEGVQVEHTV